LTTTTKVFVILVCLFALIFTPLAVQFVAREVNWRKAAEDARDQAETAYANERSMYGVAAAEVSYYDGLLKAERSNLATAQSRIAELERELDAVKQERNDLKTSDNRLLASVHLLTAQMDVETSRNKALYEAREKALKNERDLRTQNIQLTDRVKELSSEVIILDQQTKQRAEELASFREENRKLRDQLKLGQGGQVAVVATPTAVGVTPVAGAGPIAADITEVKGPLATLNVGSASGVRQGMVMVVTRSGNYVCDLEITSNVTANEAVGRIMYEEPGRRIRVNDKARDATSFETRR
jgi:hypothetical protein